MISSFCKNVIICMLSGKWVKKSYIGNRVLPSKIQKHAIKHNFLCVKFKGYDDKDLMILQNAYKTFRIVGDGNKLNNCDFQ